MMTHYGVIGNARTDCCVNRTFVASLIELGYLQMDGIPNVRESSMPTEDDDPTRESDTTSALSSGQVTVTSVDTIEQIIAQRRSDLGRPIIVGVSGYCGSGKSTLVRGLVQAKDGMVRLRGDDFLDPSRSQRRSSDWNGVDRQRLMREVLIPFREQRRGMFRRFDWSTRSLGGPEPIPLTEVLLVDLIGLFHPEAMDCLDLSIWVDVPLEIACQRGLQRDAELGRNHLPLWRDVWVPNEIDFQRHFGPRERAEVLYVP